MAPHARLVYELPKTTTARYVKSFYHIVQLTLINCTYIVFTFSLVFVSFNPVIRFITIPTMHHNNVSSGSGVC